MDNALVKRVAALPPAHRKAFLDDLDPEELEQLSILSEGLLDFIPRVSPRLQSPYHLRPLVEVLESTQAARWKGAVSTPPQHGKTETCLHGLIWLLKRDPFKRHAYVTYEATRAERHNKMLQDIADRAGLKWTGNRQLWRTPQGGGVVAAGVGGPLTGEPVDGLMLVDDPVKNQVEAQSSLFRERADEWFKTVAITRCHPSSSQIVVQTRWHEDDLSGRLIKRPGWRRINLPAVASEVAYGRNIGQELWPEGRPLAFLLEVKQDVGEYVWAALYQGEPRPRGGTVFGEPAFYKELPKAGSFRIAIGVDLAYSKKTVADYSVAVVLMMVRDPFNAKKPPVFYVLEVVRQQVQAPAFKATLRALREKYANAPMRWYASGVEQGVGDFIKAKDGELPGVPILVVPTHGDKFIRAQPVAAAHNAGRVLVPNSTSIVPSGGAEVEDVPWLNKFTAEVGTFTGVNDANDDQVDALAAAYDELVDGWQGHDGDLAAYRGFVPRSLSAADTRGNDDWSRPNSHADDQDKLPPRSRW